MEKNILQQENENLKCQVRIAKKILKEISEYDTEKVEGYNDRIAWANAYFKLKRKATQGLIDMETYD